ncbi:MAG TPA: dTMP kinase [Burkholderiales bacterium]|nr:dTMP kinase [Burkholderiales bacterium]
MKPGLFITFEGIDGAGKSTHVQWSAQFLRGQGVELALTREPGGTALGEKLRELLLASEGRIHGETEALLMFSARRQHLEEIIRPALMRGTCILCDRFTDASFAYQGGGRGVDKKKLAILEAWVHPGLQPDLTFLFDVSAHVGRDRVARIKSPDRFERENAEFFVRVRDAYLERMEESPRRFVRIDGTKPILEIQRELGNKLKMVLSQWKT